MRDSLIQQEYEFEDIYLYLVILLEVAPALTHPQDYEKTGQEELEGEKEKEGKNRKKTGRGLVQKREEEQKEGEGNDHLRFSFTSCKKTQESKSSFLQQPALC